MPKSPTLTSPSLPQGLAHDEWSIEDLDRALVPSIASLATIAQAEQQLIDDQASRLRRLALLETGKPPATVPLPTAAAGPRAPSASRASTGPARTVVIASGKGGVGKTTLSVNLAIALAARGVRTTLLDADFGTANADVICGLSPHARIDHVLAPGGVRWGDGAPKTLRDIAVDAPGGFRLIPGSTGVARMADLSASERSALVSALADLDRDTDVLLIDAGAGVGPCVTSLMAAADSTLVVATPEPTSIADAYALIKCALAAHGADRFVPGLGSRPPIGMILNQVLDSGEAARVHARIAAVCERFLGLPVPLLGSIAQDVRVAQAVRARTPLLLRTPTVLCSHQIRQIGERLAQDLGLGALGNRADASRGGVSGLVRRLLGFSS